MPKNKMNVNDVLPSDIEAEEALLAVLVWDGARPGVPEKAFSIIDADEFYGTVNKDVFTKLRDAHNSGAVLDDEAIRSIIGVTLLRYFRQEVPAPGNLDFYASRVREAARKRKVAEISYQAAKAALNGKSSGDVLADLFHQVEILQKYGSDFEPQFITSATPRPPETEFLFHVGDVGFIAQETVGAIAATGGTGKSFLVSHLGAALASGRRFGPIEPSGKKCVMLLNAEDDDATITIRILDITGGSIPNDFLACSLSGRIEPLLETENGMPRRGKWFSWMDRLLSKHNIDVLILDPFSRFYGADENNSTHGTAWINALEYLRIKHSITIIVCHHTNEASQQSSGRMNKTMCRGTSALTDGYRWVFGMRKMTEADAANYGLGADRKAYVELDDIKRNSGKALQGPLYFRQNDETGVFEHVGPSFNRLMAVAKALVNAIEKTGAELSRRELVDQKAGKTISDMVSDSVTCKFVRSKDMDKAIDYCLENGWLIEAKINTGKTKKTAIMRDNGAENLWRETARKIDFASLSVCNNSELTARKNNDAEENFRVENINDSNNLTPLKNHPLKGGVGSLAPFPSTGVLGRPEDCLRCTSHHDRGGKNYCIEHVDHKSRMKNDTPCAKARPQCRGPY